jgi:hypothetical protein
MDSDISPIFGNTDEPDKKENDFSSIVHDIQDASNINDVLSEEPHPLPQLQPEYSQHYIQQHPQPMMYPYAPPPPVPHTETQPKWDPFSSVGATAWVVMALAFIIGFVIGKLR